MSAPAPASPLVSGATRRYVLAVSALGGVVLVATLVGLGRATVAGAVGTPLQFLFAGVLGLGGYLVLKSLILFDWRGQRVALAPDEVLVFLALYALPFPLVMLFAVPAMVAYQFVTKRDLMRGSFNVSVLLIATGAAVAASYGATLAGAPLIVAALAGILVYTPVNLALVTIVFALRENAHALAVYRERFAFPTLLHFALGSSGGIAILALWNVSPFALLALLPFLYFARSHVQFTARFDREAVVHKRLAEVSQALVGEPDEETVAKRVLETCGEVFHAGRVTLTVAEPTGAPRTWRRDGHGGFDPRRRALAQALPGRDHTTLGALTIHPTRDTHEEFTTADLALLRVVAGEAAASIEHARVLHDLEDSRKQILSQRVARPLVKRIMRALMDETRADHTVLMRLGQALARDAEARDLETLCAAYEEMGLGSLVFDSKRGSQYFFQGNDLFERAPGAHATTCYLALGFLTGVVSRIHTGGTAMGTEIACESRGADACKFVVQVKDTQV